MIGVQLNIGEGRHALARNIFFGRLGELRRYPIVRSHGDGSLRPLRDPAASEE